MKQHGTTLVLLLCIVCAIGFYTLSGHKPVDAVQPPKHAIAQPTQPATDDYSVKGKPTIDAQAINNYLCTAHSPACGTGNDLYNLGVEYGIDPVYPLAFFHHESDYGLAGMARVTKSLGNLRCINNAACINASGTICEPGQSCYAAFSSWAEGYRAWYELIDSSLYIGAGLDTIPQIIRRYAPPSDNNNDSAYISDVERTVDLCRQGL